MEINKVMVFKNKSIDEIESILNDCSKTIKTYINNCYYKSKNTIDNILLFHENNNNHIGADLIHRLPNDKVISIEVKFGQKTDKNIGIMKFNKIFSCDIFSKILSVNIRKNWINLFFNAENQNEEKQFERLFNSLNQSIKYFNEFNEKKN